MITAVDSCVLFDVVNSDPNFALRSYHALLKASEDGQIIISSVAIAEIFPSIEDQMNAFLDDLSIAFQPSSYEAAISAGKLFANYRLQGGKKDRVIADFLVGAHALAHADRLLTRDTGFKRTYFSDLEIWYP